MLIGELAVFACFRKIRVRVILRGGVRKEGRLRPLQMVVTKRPTFYI